MIIMVMIRGSVGELDTVLLSYRAVGNATTILQRILMAEILEKLRLKYVSK